MNEAIPQLLTHDDAALDAAFATLAEEVRTEAAALQSIEAQEAFRLRWIGRKGGRLKHFREMALGCTC